MAWPYYDDEKKIMDHVVQRSVNIFSKINEIVSEKVENVLINKIKQEMHGMSNINDVDVFHILETSIDNINNPLLSPFDKNDIISAIVNIFTYEELYNKCIFQDISSKINKYYVYQCHDQGDD